MPLRLTLLTLGTLMAPQVLHRVIYGCSDLDPNNKTPPRFQPAVLHGYRRYRVRDEEYPGIVAATETGDADSVGDSQMSVLGTLVSGLTDSDIRLLDDYEGSEYVRERILVRTADKSLGLASSGEKASADMSLLHAFNTAEATNEVSAMAYVWVAGRERLEEAEWDFQTFTRDKLSWWVTEHIP
ncbi:hypothetical protein N7510_003483 [Penicillium lagena]|uniref:uncharacterized protein n=1 Tax=Penicillium lagena TaxID=94218 RepID=UPI002540705D|nr:uncharacterized protein N7510_003483 [Penicillium lagena]KAJ5619499.1 hypothetical protein N7510_003483 [Penicillium lagena]